MNRTAILFCLSFVFLLGCKSKTTIHPQRKNIVESVYASGTIIPENEYYSYALISGTIIQKNVKDGDSVKKGQILYVIQNDAPSARADAARSALSAAATNTSSNSPVLKNLKLVAASAASRFHTDSLNFERYKKLLGEGAITKSQLDAAQLAYITSLNEKQSAEERYISTRNDLQVAQSNARSQLSVAESDLGNFYIRSDHDGVVFKTLKEVGESVRPGEQVALLGEKDGRTIKMAVDQQDIDRIKIGQQILLKTDITGSTIFKAQVTRLYPVMNTSDQTFRVDGIFDSLIAMPFIHHSVEANIIIQRKDQALVIPRSALIGNDSTIILRDGKEQKVFVKTGIHTLDDVEILSGLDEKSEVVAGAAQ